ncbi:MAG TPA: hypothetical protein VF177_10035 [Anaerolineae bacterium]
MIPSPYRHLAAPIREYVEKMLAENPNSFVHVIMGHLAMKTAWEQALHQNSVFIFNLALTGLERVVVTIVPHHVRPNNGVNGSKNGHLNHEVRTEKQANLL